MARIRSIHPGIFTDEAFMTASAHARLLIMGLWCEAHDDGVFDWKPLTLKVRLMPADTVDVAPLLVELERLNFVRRFTVKGKTFGVIRNFQKYQRPKKPNSSGVLPDSFLSYARGDGSGSGVVEDGFGTGGEPVHHGEEDGEERREGEDGGGAVVGALARETARPSASPTSKGTDEIGPWLRSLVGTEPVLTDLNTRPIEELLAEGLTRDDVEAGIAAAMADREFRPRSWKSLVGWVRRAAKDRLQAAPKVHFRTADQPVPLPDPELIRRHQVYTAASFLRGDNHPSRPRTYDPDSPDCNLSEDVIADARAIIDMERSETPQQKAKRLGFVLETAH